MSKIQDWLEKDKLVLLEGWARDGLTEEQIAHNIGIDKATLYRWKIKDCNICNALKKGKEVVDFEVENALYKNAIDGNVTAQIYWLKNRKPDKWRDKIDIYTNEKEISRVEELLSKIEQEANNDN